MQQKSFTVVLAIATLLSVSCTQDDLRRLSPKNSIIASIQSPSTRTAVDDSPTEGTEGTVSGIVWTNGDQLGVFNQTGASQTLYTKVGTGKVAKATFQPSTDSNIEPYRAYYPYSESNNGRPWTSLLGNLPAEQPADEGNLSGDYKVGQANGGTSENGYEFVFTHLFSLCRITLNASGTALNGDKLKSIDISVTRGETPVRICGDFTFNLRTLAWAPETETEVENSRISLTWTDGPTLDGTPIISYISLFPNVKEDDKITISVHTENHTATISANCRVEFKRENIYNIPLTLDEYSSLEVDGNPVGGGTETEPTEPTVTTGTFTACAFNVDGLPQKIGLITINGDGPGSSGTTTMAGIANNLGWDIIAASEDFEHHSQLASGLSNYNAGTYRGTVTREQLTKRADTDGMCFFWKKGLTVTSEGNSPGSNGWEKMVQYNDEYGGLTGGANTCIKKGFRHYEVEVAEGVIVDVYITHMNTYSGSGNTESNDYVKAVLGQLRQLRDYVLEKAQANKRPAIIMGDTNMRYTRHDIKTNFLDVVAAYDNNAGYTVSDPWVEFHRGGVYPEWNSFSLMTRFAFAGDTENDIVCADNQCGEVVDKIWYINVPGAEVQLKATAHKNDVDNFRKSTSSVSYSGVMMEDANGSNTSGNTKYNSGQNISYTKDVGYSDHFPVVTTFEWTKTVIAAQ